MLSPKDKKQTKPYLAPNLTPDQRAESLFYWMLDQAQGIPLPPSIISPLMHWNSMRPLGQGLFKVTEATVPQVCAVKARHSFLDKTTVIFPSTTINVEGIRRLDGYGAAIRETFRHGAMNISYGPISARIWTTMKGQLTDSRRNKMEHTVTFNPAWFTSYTSMMNFLNMLLLGIRPEISVIRELHCACDMGLPAQLFKMLQASDRKHKGAGFDNGNRTLRGKFNRMQYGAGNDTETDYDKGHEQSYRKPVLAECLADVPWWRHERKLKGPKLPIKFLSEFPKLAEFEPFTTRNHRLAQINLDRIRVPSPHWQKLYYKLVKFDVVMKRESQAQAVKALNGSGHFRRLVKGGYVTLRPVALDLVSDWQAAIQDFCSPTGNLKLLETGNLFFEEDHGYF